MIPEIPENPLPHPGAPAQIANHSRNSSTPHPAEPQTRVGPPVVAITGANGWLGRCVKNHFLAAGWQVRDLVRNPSGPAARRFILGEEVSDETLLGCRALVHCAYDFTARGWSAIEEINIRGSERLFEAANRAGVTRLVCVSTMSAFSGTKSLYGKAKLEIERRAAEHQAFIVRPGLITGEAAGGMFGSLQQQVRKGGMVPLIAGEAVLYLVDQHDLSELIFRACIVEKPFPRELVIAAHSQGWSFRAILEELARRQGASVRFLPIPWRFVWAGLRVAEAVGVRLGFRSDSVLSLANQDTAPNFASQTAVAFVPSGFAEAGTPRLA